MYGRCKNSRRKLHVGTSKATHPYDSVSLISQNLSDGPYLSILVTKEVSRSELLHRNSIPSDSRPNQKRFTIFQYIRQGNCDVGSCVF